MNNFMKYLGAIVMLIGVLFLAVPYFAGIESNATLWTGLILEIIGFVGHIVLNRRAGA
ncbi:hypothetical protein [Falsiporphyromonas endometrii]